MRPAGILQPVRPVLFYIPPGLPIYSYGVMLGLSLVVGWYITLGLCEKDGLAFIPWAPVHDLDANPALRKLAQDRGVTPHQVALAWLLKRSPAMVPIPGTASVAHLEENVAAAAIELTEQELSALPGSSAGKGRPSRRR